MKPVTETVADLLGLSISEATQSGSSLVDARRALLTKPISSLSESEVWELLKSGVGEKYLVLPAISHLERDPTFFGLLTTLLRVREFSWKDNPHVVHRVRAIVSSALSELAERDGSEAIVIESMRQKIPILEEWAYLERLLSQVP
jgi:hypothetical protein